MKKILVFFGLCIIPQFHYSQTSYSPNDILDESIDLIWKQSDDRIRSIQDIGPESLGNNRAVSPLIPPSRTRTIVPGNREIVLPIEGSEGALNASPNDAKAYILYSRAVIAYRNQQLEKAREIYRELIQRYPTSSYTPYALYTLSITEKDYKRKIRILLTIKERFPNFSETDLVLDSLGDIYYVLDSIEAAEEVFQESKSSYALYMRAMLALDSHKPNKAISLIREFLKIASDKESAYQAYMLYVEALMAIKSYDNALVILNKAVGLRPWAYDNGALILFNAGKAFFYSGRGKEALYTFSLLRLRFSRTAESRLADQYLVALNQRNIVSMQTVPWLAKSFDTIIKEQTQVQLKVPPSPSVSDILEMTPNLPSRAVPTPDIDSVNYLPPMPLPTPPGNEHSVLVPISDGVPRVDVITITNTVFKELTNKIETIMTNRVFVIETNTITNNFTAFDSVSVTNMITNIVQSWRTNTVVSYEPVVVWHTNNTPIPVQQTNFTYEPIVVWRTNDTPTPVQQTNLTYEPIVIWQTNTTDINRTNMSYEPIAVWRTNIIDINRTNMSYEPIAIWRTNIIDINRTNMNYEPVVIWSTNITDIDRTNMSYEPIVIWHTNSIGQTNMSYEPVVVWHTNRTDIGQTNLTYESVIVWRTNEILGRTNLTYEPVVVWNTNTTQIGKTNIIQEPVVVWRTNAVVGKTNTTYEPIVVWRTNTTQIGKTNWTYEPIVLWHTNISTIDQTNKLHEPVILWRTNYINATNITYEPIGIWYTNNINQTNTSYESMAVWYTNDVPIFVTNTITNITDFVVTNERIEVLPLFTTNFNVIDRPEEITNKIKRLVTNRYLEYGINNTTNWKEDITTHEFTEVIPAWKTAYVTLGTNMLTNVIQTIVTNRRLEITPNWFNNVRTNDTVKIVDDIITNTRLQTAPFWLTNFSVIETNISNIFITNVETILQTNFVEQLATNNASVEAAPLPIEPPLLVLDDPQLDMIEEPIYQQPVDEGQELFVSEEVSRLEAQVSIVTEKAAGIAGQYGFSDNKGFVVRIAQLKDISVATIVVQDLAQFNFESPVGIYYRNELYYVEIRAIKDYKVAQHISQTLYKAGYTDVQVFEQFQITEYQEE